MSWFFMVLGLLIFLEGLFFQFQTLKPAKGFRYIAWDEGYNIELVKPIPHSMFDKDGKDITDEVSLVIFRKVTTPSN